MYNSCTSRYIAFCKIRQLQPWPVDPIVLCGWIHRLMCTISSNSLRSYLAAVKYTQHNLGHAWHLDKNESIRRTIRTVKRRFPSITKGVKMPITLGILRKILPLLPGWPLTMSHEDHMFATASIIAVTCFLRGGEFLTHTKSDRAVLRFSNIMVRTIKDIETLVVAVTQPKTRWWMVSVDVPAFGACTGPFNPTTRWKDYIQQSPMLKACKAHPDSTPAFHFANGRPLTRDYMAKRTLLMLKQANIETVDSTGAACTVLAASWRAGAVRSAWDANISETLIMELGRWRSNAWQHYLLLSSLDLRQAGDKMWSNTRCPDRQAVVRPGLGPELI